MANFVGTTGNDVFTDGVGANDTIYDGGGGSDSLDAGSGNDQITITGGASNDTVYGGLGNDVLVIDWSGENEGFTSFSFNVTTGSGGLYDNYNTRVDFSGIERLNISTGFGDDQIEGLDGADTMSSGSGDDAINTRRGAASVDGGAGNDLWQADYTGTNASVNLDLNEVSSTWGSGANVTFVTNIERVGVTGSDIGDDIVTRLGDTNDGFGDTVNGGSGNDTVTVGGGYDFVDGGTGTLDLLVVNWATEHRNVSTFGNIINGSGGYWDGTNGTRVDFSNIERFEITTGFGNDSVYTGNGADRATLGSGNDYVNTAQGAATVDGGAGNDSWQADFTNNATAVSVNLNNATSVLGNGSEITGVEAVNLSLGNGADVVRTRVGVVRDGFNDRVAGGFGDDTVTVGGGYDTVEGGGGTSDLLIVDYANAVRDIGTFAFNTGSDNAGGYWDGSDRTRVNFVGFERYDVTTGSGFDAVQTGDGADVVSLGAGDDSVNTRAGAATVNGGSGNDSWSADFSATNQAVSLNLNLANSILGNGSRVQGVEAISIAFGLGDDVVVTRTGNVYDGFGDNVNGGDGNDTMTVGGGSDTVTGGLGDQDRLVVDWSNDHQGQGTDYLEQAAGRVIYSHGSGVRVEAYSIEDITFLAGAGDDNIGTLDGSDSVNSGAGDDVVDTNKGSATVDGGAGRDLWRADYSDTTAAIDLTLNAASDALGNGSTVSNVEAIDLIGTSVADTIVTRTGVVHDGFSDTVRGGDGDDSITVGGGSDFVFGEGGEADLLTVNYAGTNRNVGTEFLDLGGVRAIYNDGAGARVDTIGLERLNITTGSGNDGISTLDGADTVSGGAGNDYFDTNRGAANVTGGSGNDTWRADFSDDDQAINLNLNQTTSVLGNGSRVTQVEAVYIEAGGGSDVITTLTGAAAIFNDSLYGGLGDDTFTVGGGVDYVDGGGGFDVLNINLAGVGGNFRVYFNDPANGAGGITNDAGTQIQWTGIERVVFGGGDGSEAIVGTNNNDTLNGGAGNDTLSGNDGDDVLTGGVGADQLNGGNGIDEVRYASASGVDRVTPANGLGEGAGDTFSSIERFVLSNGADSYRGSTEAATILGGDGADTLIGSSADDTLDGGAGADTLEGGVGNDSLIGGSGVDVASYAGAGAGVAVSLGVTGFQVTGSAGEDKLAGIENLEGSAFADTLTGDGAANTLAGGDGADTLAAAGGNDRVEGEGGADSLDGAGGKDTLLGGDGLDTLIGGAGADRLTGGLGADVFVFDDGDSGPASAARDQILDFSEAEGDVIDLSAIDANSATGTDDAFSSFVTGGLTGVVGQLSATAQSGGKFLVEGDTDGDGDSDFSVIVTSSVVFDGNEFVL